MNEVFAHVVTRAHKRPVYWAVDLMKEGQTRPHKREPPPIRSSRDRVRRKCAGWKAVGNPPSKECSSSSQPDDHTFDSNEAFDSDEPFDSDEAFDSDDDFEDVDVGSSSSIAIDKSMISSMSPAARDAYFLSLLSNDESGGQSSFSGPVLPVSGDQDPLDGSVAQASETH